MGGRERCAGGPAGAGVKSGLSAKKNAARGDSDGVFHFIELPKGRDSFFDEAARRVGADREDGKRKKSPSAKKRRGCA